jgi:mRNA interferase RelE/StbE
MASYKVVLKPSVEKDLRALPKAVVNRLWARIGSLADDPHPRQSVKLTGAERLYRVRVGDYRIVYGVDIGQMIVTVHYVRHRSKAYRD